MKRLLAVTAAACLFAAPFALAQTQPAQTTPQATQAAPPTSQPATPAPAPQATPAQTAAAPDGDARCRTRKDAGEQCSCLSAPTDFGTSAPAASGSHNMCVISASTGASTRDVSPTPPTATPEPTPAPQSTPAPTTPPAQQQQPTPRPN